jgi:nucleoid-associated protein YgaU
MRQSPLAAQGSPGARPTIVLATAAPAVSVASSPVPSVVATPTVAVIAASPGELAASPGGGGSDYVVQPGDTLRSIAEREYGDATQWPRIYQANRDVIGPDPDALQAGMRLRLPDQ